jgi:hypothetical protein
MRRLIAIILLFLLMARPTVAYPSLPYGQIYNLGNSGVVWGYDPTDNLWVPLQVTSQGVLSTSGSGGGGGSVTQGTSPWVDNITQLGGSSNSINSNGALGTWTQSPALSTYALTSVSGTATLAGYFVDSTGTQASALQTFSITTATTVTALYNTANSITSGTPLPSNFVGFRGSLAGAALWFGNGGTSTGTITAGYSPTTNYPEIATATYLTLGRV